MADSFKVVINHEEQYSIWPADRPVGGEWQEVGFAGEGERCLAHVQRVWRDINPRDLQRLRREIGLEE